jgi:hypothetical protein
MSNTRDVFYGMSALCLLGIIGSGIAWLILKPTVIECGENESAYSDKCKEKDKKKGGAKIAFFVFLLLIFVFLGLGKASS